MTIYFSKSTKGFYDTDHNLDIPSDKVEITKEYRQFLLEENSRGKVIDADENGYPMAKSLPPPSIDQLKRYFSTAVRNHMDNVVKEKFYNNVETACSYIVSTNPQYKAEAEACIAWRDAVWAAYTAIEITYETDINAVIESLPKLTWPTV